MPVPTPFHPVTSALCQTNEWREWSGYLAAASYQHEFELEYFAIRDSAALIDVTPLYKYDLRGPQAQQLANRIVCRDLSRTSVGQIVYTPWCDDDGQVVDDGTVWHVADDHYRITAADSSLRWFQDCGLGLEAEVSDRSSSLAALALQGPKSRAVLLQVAGGDQLEQLGYYRLAEGEIGGAPVTITRTGYTGDLGYELWMAPEHAETVWQRLMVAGEPYGIRPVGLAALDMARIEAGLLLIEVDYISSLKALTDRRKSTPFELGLGWTVALDGPDFIGRRRLLQQGAQPPEWALVGLEVEWSELDRLYSSFDLAPQVAGRASRLGAPLYHDGRHVGQATSLAFSPLLKRYLALASVEHSLATLGQPLELEITVEYQRSRAAAQVVRKPFYDPPHKRA